MWLSGRRSRPSARWTSAGIATMRFLVRWMRAANVARVSDRWGWAMTAPPARMRYEALGGLSSRSHDWNSSTERLREDEEEILLLDLVALLVLHLGDLAVRLRLHVRLHLHRLGHD